MAILQMRLHGCTKYSMVKTKHSSSTPHMLILQQKLICFSIVIHLFKNIGSNLLNQKKFAFSSFQFYLFHHAIHVPDGYISWSAWNRRKSSGSAKKSTKKTYQVTHPGNNKQNVPLTLEIFQESTTMDMMLRTSWCFFIKFSLFAIPNNVSIYQTNWQCSNSRR